MKQRGIRNLPAAAPRDGDPDGPVGLVMTGGGARGAYQAGVLKRIGEINRVRRYGNPFPIITAASAGSINGAGLAAGCQEFSQTTKRIADLWSALKPSDIFRCDVASQAHNSLTWMLDLALGAVGGGGNARSLLDASPLREYLLKNVAWKGIEENIRSGDLYALAISATNYHSGKSYLFIQGEKGHPVWNRVRRVTLATEITVDHICASAAIPIVFQAVRLVTPVGPAFFGDGCARLQQPLSPAIRLGANKLVAIGVRCENSERHCETAGQNDPTLAQIAGVLFNVMFLDHLSTDIEHLERLNELLAGGRMRQPLADGSKEVRRVAVLAVTPSVDLSSVAEQHQGDMPYLIQHFIGGLGRDTASCADLMSYLLFTSKFTRALVEIGYEDAGKRVDEIEAFLYSGVVAGKRQAPPLRQTA